MNDTDKQIQLYAKRLQKMIRCKTVSVKNSYDDTEFSKLRIVMEELFPFIHKHAKKMTFGDDCWMYYIEGKEKNRNIMLMSHHDVVAVEGEWKYDGFSGEIAEGKIWGRGTVDTKTPLFAEFTALEELLEEGYELPCNVYIGSSHNEEIAGDGVPKALEYFKGQGITFEVILDEGGAVIDPPVGGMKVEKCAMVAVHEKGFYHLNCTATTGSGHAGLTAGQTATPVERMSAFVHEISSKNIFIRRLNPQITAMFTQMAPHCKFPMNLLFGNLWLFGGVLKRVMPSLSAAAGGLLGTTCVFNEINGTREEKCCTAKATLRPVHAADWQKDLKAFIDVAKKYNIMVEVDETSEYHEPADMTKPQLAYTFDCIKQVFPAYPPIPMILPAGTDARHFTEICPCILRFAPIRLSAQQLASVHSENENIDLDAIGDAVAFYKTFIRGYR
ncbi:MAG: M20/M25/M40 family metallo-hydrolase [Agathobacter sp.]|nr:M20/M25/M40 family metallo-hydrolase [Agathobacter sp.]